MAAPTQTNDFSVEVELEVRDRNYFFIVSFDAVEWRVNSRK